MIFKKLVTVLVTSLALTTVSSLSIIVLLSQHAVAADLTVNISDVEQGGRNL